MGCEINDMERNTPEEEKNKRNLDEIVAEVAQ